MGWGQWLIASMKLSPPTYLVPFTGERHPHQNASNRELARLDGHDSDRWRAQEHQLCATKYNKCRATREAWFEKRSSISMTGNPLSQPTSNCHTSKLQVTGSQLVVRADIRVSRRQPNQSSSSSSSSLLPSLLLQRTVHPRLFPTRKSQQTAESGHPNSTKRCPIRSRCLGA